MRPLADQAAPPPSSEEGPYGRRRKKFATSPSTPSGNVAKTVCVQEESFPDASWALSYFVATP